ncbi:MAG TPA: LON peptidase substrate-binding domain-containing protein [Ktedonobacteraceae bacterium]|jgi:Lon protease-like protein|nr:LON peptidase substrate-binding domain-containing protein [Ktedonobacteraceae bacterium]
MSTAAIELPLFPLDAVLFPGTALPLHIFEERYRAMVADCIREEKPFGIVLVNAESEHLQEEPHAIGTMAVIRDVEELEDGRYNLIAIGTKRFRIVAQDRTRLYLSGEVELFEDAKPEDAAQTAINQARTLFMRYLELLLDDEDAEAMEQSLPDEPEELSHFIAYFLDIGNEQKQSYLEMTSTQQRLEAEVTILRREIPFMRKILEANLSNERARLN